MSSTPQPGVQPVDLAQNLLQSNPSAEALVRQLAQMQVQNQPVSYQQQVWPTVPLSPLPPKPPPPFSSYAPKY